MDSRLAAARRPGMISLWRNVAPSSALLRSTKISPMGIRRVVSFCVNAGVFEGLNVGRFTSCHTSADRRRRFSRAHVFLVCCRLASPDLSFVSHSAFALENARRATAHPTFRLESSSFTTMCRASGRSGLLVQAASSSSALETAPDIRLDLLQAPPVGVTLPAYSVVASTLRQVASSHVPRASGPPGVNHIGRWQLSWVTMLLVIYTPGTLEGVEPNSSIIDPLPHACGDE